MHIILSFSSPYVKKKPPVQAVLSHNIGGFTTLYERVYQSLNIDFLSSGSRAAILGSS